MDMEQFKRGCLPGSLTEVSQKGALDVNRRKDLVKLLLELDDLKNDYQRIVEKKDKLANMIRFNKSGFAAT